MRLLNLALTAAAAVCFGTGALADGCCTMAPGGGMQPKAKNYKAMADTRKGEQIFNGKTLAGWEVMGGNKQAFYVKDGIMECNGKGGGWIRYTKPVDDFILNMKFKVSPGANSGVFVRSQKEGDPPYTGFEVQILDTYGQKANVHSNGAIYDVLAPRFENSKPAGEWNDFIIVADGPIVKVWLNGLNIIDMDLDQYTGPVGKFSVPYKDLKRTGYIGFQDHGHPLSFKDITLIRL